MKLVLITGSRDWIDFPMVDAVVQTAKLVVHGGAEGADSMAGVCAVLHSIPYVTFPVGRYEWLREGRRAGPLRNHRMIRFALDMRQLGYVVECHAFPLPQSRGTIQCMDAARHAGISVFEHKP